MSNSNLPTGSALQRAIACPASESLPHVKRNSADAEAGNWRHWYLEHVGKLGVDEALEAVPKEHREMCAEIDLEGLPTDLATEVTFAYNWKTGEARELGRGLKRNYSGAGPDEIVGTIDALGLSETMLYLGDYKGWNLVKAKDNAQLLFPALCGSKIYGLDSAVIEIINIRGGSNWRSRATVDLFDLGAFEEKLRETMFAIERARAGQVLPFVEGDHCRYCPAFDSCPAKTKLLVAMAGGESIPTLNQATARKAYETWKAMQELTKMAGARIYAFAAENPIELDDGMVFGPHEKLGKESVDGDAAYELLRKRLGQKYADDAVTRKATKKGITGAVREAKRDSVVTGTQKAEVDSLLTELRASGAATRKKSIVVEEHKPKPKQIEGSP